MHGGILPGTLLLVNVQDKGIFVYICSHLFSSETCRCPKKVYTNWASYPPYVNSSSDGLLGGIFGSFFLDMITDVCGTCPNGHGATHVNLESGVTGFPAKKETPNEVKSSISDENHLSFPVIDYVNEDHIYVEIVQSPGIALITLRETRDGKNGVLMNTVFNCWPIVIMCMAMCSLAAVIIWFNVSHFVRLISFFLQYTNMTITF